MSNRAIMIVLTLAVFAMSGAWIMMAIDRRDKPAREAALPSPFSHPAPVEFDHGIAALALGDLDGDDIADLVALTRSQTERPELAGQIQPHAAADTPQAGYDLIARVGDGHGRFTREILQTHFDSAPPDPARELLRLADLDADGDQDIVLTTAQHLMNSDSRSTVLPVYQRLRVLENLKDGRMRQVAVPAIWDRVTPGSYEVAHMLDPKGSAQIIVGAGASIKQPLPHPIVAVLQLRSHRIVEVRRMELPGIRVAPRLLIGDVDGDKRADVAAIRGGVSDAVDPSSIRPPDESSLQLITEELTRVVDASYQDGFVPIMVADIDDDGFADVIWNSMRALEVLVQRGSADGLVEPVPVTNGNFFTSGSRALAARVDTDGDGIDELVLPGWGRPNNVVAWNVSKASISLKPASQILLPTRKVTREYRGKHAYRDYVIDMDVFAVGDIDGDHRQDLVGASSRWFDAFAFVSDGTRLKPVKGAR